MSAGISGQKQIKHPAGTRKNGPNRPIPATPVGIVSVTKSLAVMTIVLNTPVSLKGVPAYTTNIGGVTAIGAAMTNPTTLALTFSASIAAATSLVIPFGEPAMRSSSGGYLTPGTFPV